MEDLSLLEVFDLYARQAQVHVNLIPNFILYCQYSNQQVFFQFYVLTECLL
jgi:hypothetical protein